MQLKSERWVVEQCQSLLVQGCRMPTQKHFYLQPRKSICNKSLPMWFAERLRVFKLLYNARGGMIRSPTPEKYATVDKGFTDRTCIHLPVFFNSYNLQKIDKSQKTSPRPREHTRAVLVNILLHFYRMLQTGVLTHFVHRLLTCN
jgi:hypothetical protein